MACELSAAGVQVSFGETAAVFQNGNGRRLRSHLPLLVGICAVWALCSLAPIWKYLSRPKAAIATLVCVISIMLAMYGLDRLNYTRRQIGMGWILLLYLVLSAAMVVLYPLSLKHPVNQRSDREDAIRLELNAIRHHQAPYASRTFLGNPPTPLPGALVLATPFFAIGHVAWQNFLWLALFFYFTVRFFRYHATAILYLAVFLLFAPSNLSDLTSGGDYLANIFYVAIAIFCFVKSLNRPPYVSIASAVFLGLALSSRGIYPLLLIPLLVFTLQRATRLRSAVSLGVVLITAAVVTLPIFMPHPVTNLLSQLNQNPGKLRYLPAVLHPQWTLPLMGLAVVCTSVFVHMDMRRIFLIFSLATFAMLLPPIAAQAFCTGKLPYECSYLSVGALFFGLWAFSMFERRFEAVRELGSQAPTSMPVVVCDGRHAL